MADLKHAIGLMSGTSMDGIDIALISSDGENRLERGPAAAMPYSPGLRLRLQAALQDVKMVTDRNERPGVLRQLEHDQTLLHAVAVQDFLHANGLQASDIAVIGFHGQTVLHRPQQGLTLQIGDGALLARETGIAVVYDMRAEDMRHGGEGAPLIPVYHRALAQNLPATAQFPVVFVNIGGISNLTYIGADGELLAYDSGPGNMLIDQWMELHQAGSFDEGGATARHGAVNEAIAGKYLAQDFFTSNRRRSLDRGDFAVPEKHSMTLADGARTLAYLSAAAILRSARHLPVRPLSYVVSGGGRKNGAIMEELRRLAARDGAAVIDADSVNLDGDAMEAEAWAYLALRSLRGLPLTFPGTTGCSVAVTGGVLARP